MKRFSLIHRRGVARSILMLAIVCLMALNSGNAQDPGEAWSWRLPPRRFGRLSQTERAQLTRAEQLVRDANYAAAAIEFEKYELQYPESDVRAHVVLMRAYSLHQARERNTAIDHYTRLLDVYANQVDEAAPTMYWMGNAYIQNGDVERGIEVLTELADDARYQQHPIADVAMNQVAAHHARLNDERTAERYWRRVLDLQAEAFIRPEQAANQARIQLADLYIRTRRYPALETALLRGSNDPDKCRETARFVYDRAMRMIGSLDARTGGEFLSWFRSKRDYFPEGREEDDYLRRTLRFAVRLNDRQVFEGLRADFAATGNIGAYYNEALGFFRQLNDRRAVDNVLPEILTYLQEQQGTAFDNTLTWVATRLVELTGANLVGDRAWEQFQAVVLAGDDDRDAAHRLRIYRALLPRLGGALANPAAQVFWETLMARAVAIYRGQSFDDRNRGLAALVDLAAAAERHARALDLIDQMDNRPLATWKLIEIRQQQEQWAAAAQSCEELEQMDNTELAMRALRTRATLYKDRLGRYEDAIRLYRQINDPPATVWATVDAYIRWQRPSEADRVLTELENFFEREAPAAAWRRVQMWEQFGNRERMIAAARAVLRRYPEHRISSQAHQFLNRHGVDLVGGGLMEADD